MYAYGIVIGYFECRTRMDILILRYKYIWGRMALESKSLM